MCVQYRFDVNFLTQNLQLVKCVFALSAFKTILMRVSSLTHHTFPPSPRKVYDTLVEESVSFAHTYAHSHTHTQVVLCGMVL